VLILEREDFFGQLSEFHLFKGTCCMDLVRMEDTTRDLDVDGRIILKWIIDK
jgi:hypothetical protein